MSKPRPSPVTGGLSRRSFLARTGLGAVVAPFAARSVNGANAGGDVLHHACIGVGGMGWVDLQNFLGHPRTRVVALCDVDANHLQRAAEAVPGARTYRDWRELLAAEGDRIDSVNVTVPDHMHYAIARSAIDRGKHVYCQKPMCHDVAEVRALTQAAQARGVITQLGTQLASGSCDRTAAMWLKQGRIGRIEKVFLSANRPGAVENYRLPGPRPALGAPPPDSLAWDLWLGTAPERPFAPDIYHPTKWRAWQDFGTGWSGDIGCHIFDAVWKGLDMQPPKAVTAEVQASWQESPERRADTWPQANRITWTFPGNRFTGGEDWTVEWADGAFYPPRHIRERYGVEDYPAESAMIIGTDGALLTWLDGTPLLLPEERFKDVRRPKFEPRNHYHHFLDACLGGEMCESHFGQTGPMTEAILLGTVAVRVPDVELRWEAAPARITNHAGADRLLRRRYRSGWEMAGF